MQHSSVMKQGINRVYNVGRIGGLLGLLLIVPLVHGEVVGEASATERASDLLDRMAEALRSLSYEGTLVYSHDNRLESLHLVHRIEQGQVLERVMSLSGPLRAVTREHDRVMCVLPEGEPIMIKRQSAAGSLLSTRSIDPTLILAYYQVDLPGVARVAGRDTEVVDIVPRDELRYGYRFYIDRDTALPLKSDLIDRDGRALEQLMFTSITVEEADTEIEALPSHPGLRSAAPTQELGRWRFDGRPAGFQLVKQGVMDHPKGAEVEHFLFTDRLSAYSIYVEVDTHDGLSGLTRIGAVNAAGRQIDGYQVTAVGEVPAATVEAAVAGVRLISDAAP